MSILSLSFVLVEVALFATVSGVVSNALSKSKSKRMFATPLLIIRLLYTDMWFCIIIGLLAVLCNMFLPHEYHGCHSNWRYYHSLVVTVVMVLLTRVWSSSYTTRLHTAISRRTKPLMIVCTSLIVISSVGEWIMCSVYSPQLSYYLIHMGTFTLILLYHNTVLEYLEGMTSVKEHLLCKILNSVSEDIELPTANVKPLPLRGRYKASNTTTKPLATTEVGGDTKADSKNAERVARLTKSEELYDSITLKLIIVCCILSVSLLFSQLNVLSVYFLALFLTSWLTLLMYCLQERNLLCFYIAIGMGNKFKHTRGIDKSVTFAKFIECLEFDDKALSPTLTTKPTVFFHTLRKRF